MSKVQGGTREVVTVLVVAVSIWTSAMALLQGRGWGASIAIGYEIIAIGSLVGFAILTVRTWDPEKPLLLNLMWMFLSCVILLPGLVAIAIAEPFYAGNWHVGLAAGTATLVGFFTQDLLKIGNKRLSGPRKTVPFLVGWMIYSAVFVLLESRPLPLYESSVRTPPSGPHIGVALSGGGYRAALMHAGVLFELQQHLSITHLSTVSGGSIIGAFYALGGSPIDFRDALTHQRLSLSNRLKLLHNVVRLPFPFTLPLTGDDKHPEIQLFPWYRFDRLDIQANLLDDVLYSHKTFGQLMERKAPLLQIGATDLNQGLSLGFSNDFTIARGVSSLKEETETSTLTAPAADIKILPGLPPQQSIGAIVAASGAFPGAFNAFRFQLGDKAEMALADGGFMENLGVSLLLDRHERYPEKWHLDLLIISDGGAIFKEGMTSRVAELTRGLDIVYAGSGWHPSSRTAQDHLPPMVLLRPSDLAEDGKSSDILTTFRDASTLKEFYTEKEASQLFTLGQELVRKAIKEKEALRFLQK